MQLSERARREAHFMDEFRRRNGDDGAFCMGEAVTADREWEEAAQPALAPGSDDQEVARVTCELYQGSLSSSSGDYGLDLQVQRIASECLIECRVEAFSGEFLPGSEQVRIGETAICARNAGRRPGEHGYEKGISTPCFGYGVAQGR
jgi:hypothetical protein